MPHPWRKRKQGPPTLRRSLVEQQQAAPTVFTNHESRDTKLGFFRITAFVESIPLGTEALQSFFFAPAGIASAEKSGLSCLVMPHPWRKRKECPPARRRFPVEQQQAAPNEFSRNTRHESRPLFRNTPLWPFGSPWVRDGWRHQKLPSGPLPPPTSHCFPVHDCSPLFTIVRHCSAKNIVLRQCPRRHFFLERTRPPPMLFTRHETRITAFYPLGNARAGRARRKREEKGEK